MPRIVRNVIRNSWIDLIPECALTAAFWLVGEIVMLLIAYGEKEPLLEMLPVSVVLALVSGSLALLILAVTRFSVEFNMLLKFPVSRRMLLVGQSAVVLLHGVVVEAVVALLGLASGVLHALLLHAPALVAFTGLGFVPWWGWLAALVAPLALGLPAGGVISRFGAKGGWALYFVFMASVLGFDHYESLFDRFDPTVLLGGAAVLAVLLPALGVHWLRKAAVKA